MLKFILGLLVGYCVSDNKDIVKKYFNMFIDWCKKCIKSLIQTIKLIINKDFYRKAQKNITYLV